MGNKFLWACLLLPTSLLGIFYPAPAALAIYTTGSQIIAQRSCSNNIDIRPEMTYKRGQSWKTCANYEFTFQNDGNLVLYSPSRKALWATGTERSGSDRFVIQNDGNVVLYAGSKVLWASDTAGSSGILFSIQADGNIVVYDRSNKPIWAAGTNDAQSQTVVASEAWFKAHSNPCRDLDIKPEVTYRRGQSWKPCSNYEFTFQNDGNLVLYSPSRKPLWATGTDNTSADRFMIQNDGNVVLYAGNKALWASDTAGNSGITFTIQIDGNVIVFNSSRRPLYATATDGAQSRTVRASEEWMNKNTVVASPILDRAKKWVDRGIAYNQGAYTDGYRQDCSGFVSMAWGLPTSAVTGTLPQYSNTLSSKDDLRPGDTINNRQVGNNGHVVLFVQWTNKEQGKFIAYEENGGWGKTLQTNLTLVWRNGSWDIPEYPNHSPWYLERKK
jgi:hypothetical protein